MAARNSDKTAREKLARQRAVTRSGAPGKRFIGERAGQSEAARLAELRTVERMAERDAALRRAEEIGTPVAAILAELFADAIQLARSLFTAPFRIALVLRQARRA